MSMRAPVHPPVCKQPPVHYTTRAVCNHGLGTEKSTMSEPVAKEHWTAIPTAALPEHLPKHQQPALLRPRRDVLDRLTGENARTESQPRKMTKSECSLKARSLDTAVPRITAALPAENNDNERTEPHACMRACKQAAPV